MIDWKFEEIMRLSKRPLRVISIFTFTTRRGFFHYRGLLPHQFTPACLFFARFCGFSGGIGALNTFLRV